MCPLKLCIRVVSKQIIFYSTIEPVICLSCNWLFILKNIVNGNDANKHYYTPEIAYVSFICKNLI